MSIQPSPRLASGGFVQTSWSTSRAADSKPRPIDGPYAAVAIAEGGVPRLCQPPAKRRDAARRCDEHTTEGTIRRAEQAIERDLGDHGRHIGQLHRPIRLIVRAAGRLLLVNVSPVGPFDNRQVRRAGAADMAL